MRGASPALYGVANSPIASLMPHSFCGVVTVGSATTIGRVTVRPAASVAVVPALSRLADRAAVSMTLPWAAGTYWGRAPGAPVAEPSIFQVAFWAGVSTWPTLATTPSRSAVGSKVALKLPPSEEIFSISAMSCGEKAAAAPGLLLCGSAPAVFTVNPLESSGVSVPFTNVEASSSVMAGIAVPSAMARVFFPRGQVPPSCLREASTSSPMPLLAGVMTGLVPSRVTVAETAPLAIASTLSSRAPRSAVESTRMTASVCWPPRR